jgi:hypothetical protein
MSLRDKRHMGKAFWRRGGKRSREDRQETREASTRVTKRHIPATPRDGDVRNKEGLCMY